MRGPFLCILPVAALLTISLATPADAAVINGTSGPDVLTGTAKADTIRGYGGLDRIYGKAGADRLFAGRDNKRDQVYGGLGNDRLHVWFGDSAYAGRGNDVVRLHAGAPWAMTHIYCGPGYDRLYTPPGRQRRRRARQCQRLPVQLPQLRGGLLNRPVHHVAPRRPGTPGPVGDVWSIGRTRCVGSTTHPEPTPPRHGPDAQTRRMPTTRSGG